MVWLAGNEDQTVPAVPAVPGGHDAWHQISGEEAIPVLDALPFAVWRTDRLGRVTFANEAYLRFNRMDRDKVLGRAATDIFPPDKAEQYGESDQLVMSTGITSVAVQEKFNRGPGEPMYVEATKWPLFDESGAVCGLQGVFSDVTERKLLDETARFLAKRSGRSGEVGFFQSLALYLVDTMGADYLSIARTTLDPLSLDALTLIVDGEVSTNTIINIAGTPCRDALSQELCVIDCNLGDRFPDNEVIRSLGLQSYVGVTLWGSGDAPIGLITAMRRLPLESIRLYESMLNLVAIRASGELERSQAETALQISEARWQFALEGAGDGVWDWDRVTGVVYRSPRFKEMLGFEEDELDPVVGASVSLTHPEDVHKFSEIERCANGLVKSFAIEVRMQRKDGQWLWILYRGMAVASDPVTGRALRIVGTQVDITERKLEAERRQFQITMQETIASASPASFFVVDLRNDRILYVDRRFFELWDLDISYEDAVAGRYQGRELSEKCSDKTVDRARGRDLLTPLLDWTNQAAGESEVALKDGRTLRVHSNQVLDANGTYFGRLFMYEDISDRKRAEESHRQASRTYTSIVESAMDAIIAVNEDLEVVSFNPAALKMFAIAPDQIANRHIQQFIPARQIADHSKFLHQFLAGDTEVMLIDDQDLVGLRSDGHEFPVEVSLSKLYLDGKKFLTVVIRDTTERQAAEQARLALESRVRVSQRSEAIGTLASGIAHDFNNILSAIYGFTDLARSDAAGNPAVLESLDELSKAGRRAAALVKQILDFSQPADADQQPIRPDGPVREAFEFLRIASPSTVEFDLRITADLPMISADPTHVHQVLMNLGTNAIQSFGTRPGRVSVVLESLDPADQLPSSSAGSLPAEVLIGHWVKLSVSDTGRGIAPDTLEKIFDPFFTTNVHRQGAGLGLAITHRIVRNCGGIISVHSQLGYGTTFDIYFPSTDAEQPAEDLDTKIALAGNGERILLVDDETALGMLGKRTLEALNYVVQVETHSTAALVLFESDPQAFDLVITDLTMPNLTGTDLARAIHVIRPDIPVILMSGYAAAAGTPALDQARIVAVLPKPFTFNDLAAIVQRVFAAIGD